MERLQQDIASLEAALTRYIQGESLVNGSTSFDDSIAILERQAVDILMQSLSLENETLLFEMMTVAAEGIRNALVQVVETIQFNKDSASAAFLKHQLGNISQSTYPCLAISFAFTARAVNKPRIDEAIRATVTTTTTNSSWCILVVVASLDERSYQAIFDDTNTSLLPDTPSKRAFMKLLFNGTNGLSETIQLNQRKLWARSFGVWDFSLDNPSIFFGLNQALRLMPTLQPEDIEKCLKDEQERLNTRSIEEMDALMAILSQKNHWDKKLSRTLYLTVAYSNSLLDWLGYSISMTEMSVWDSTQAAGRKRQPPTATFHPHVLSFLQGQEKEALVVLPLYTPGHFNLALFWWGQDKDTFHSAFFDSLWSNNTSNAYATVFVPLLNRLQSVWSLKMAKTMTFPSTLTLSQKKEGPVCGSLVLYEMDLLCTPTFGQTPLERVAALMDHVQTRYSTSSSDALIELKNTWLSKKVLPNDTTSLGWDPQFHFIKALERHATALALPTDVHLKTPPQIPTAALFVPFLGSWTDVIEDAAARLWLKDASVSFPLQELLTRELRTWSIAAYEREPPINVAAWSPSPNFISSLFLLVCLPHSSSSSRVSQEIIPFLTQWMLRFLLGNTQTDPIKQARLYWARLSRHADFFQEQTVQTPELFDELLRPLLGSSHGQRTIFKAAFTNIDDVAEANKMDRYASENILGALWPKEFASVQSPLASVVQNTLWDPEHWLTLVPPTNRQALLTDWKRGINGAFGGVIDSLVVISRTVQDKVSVERVNTLDKWTLHYRNQPVWQRLGGLLAVASHMDTTTLLKELLLQAFNEDMGQNHQTLGSVVMTMQHALNLLNFLVADKTSVERVLIDPRIYWLAYESSGPLGTPGAYRNTTLYLECGKLALVCRDDYARLRAISDRLDTVANDATNKLNEYRVERQNVDNLLASSSQVLVLLTQVKRVTEARNRLLPARDELEDVLQEEAHPLLESIPNTWFDSEPLFERFRTQLQNTDILFNAIETILSEHSSLEATVRDREAQLTEVERVLLGLPNDTLRAYFTNPLSGTRDERLAYFEALDYETYRISSVGTADARAHLPSSFHSRYKEHLAFLDDIDVTIRTLKNASDKWFDGLHKAIARELTDAAYISKLYKSADGYYSSPLSSLNQLSNAYWPLLSDSRAVPNVEETTPVSGNDAPRFLASVQNVDSIKKTRSSYVAEFKKAFASIAPEMQLLFNGLLHDGRDKQFAATLAPLDTVIEQATALLELYISKTPISTLEDLLAFCNHASLTTNVLTGIQKTLETTREFELNMKPNPAEDTEEELTLRLQNLAIIQTLYIDGFARRSTVHIQTLNGSEWVIHRHGWQNMRFMGADAAVFDTLVNTPLVKMQRQSLAYMSALFALVTLHRTSPQATQLVALATQPELFPTLFNLALAKETRVVNYLENLMNEARNLGGSAKALDTYKRELTLETVNLQKFPLIQREVGPMVFKLARLDATGQPLREFIERINNATQSLLDHSDLHHSEAAYWIENFLSQTNASVAVTLAGELAHVQDDRSYIIDTLRQSGEFKQFLNVLFPQGVIDPFLLNHIELLSVQRKWTPGAVVDVIPIVSIDPLEAPDSLKYPLITYLSESLADEIQELYRPFSDLKDAMEQLATDFADGKLTVQMLAEFQKLKDTARLTSNKRQYLQTQLSDAVSLNQKLPFMVDLPAAARTVLEDWDELLKLSATSNLAALNETLRLLKIIVEPPNPSAARQEQEIQSIQSADALFGVESPYVPEELRTVLQTYFETVYTKASDALVRYKGIYAPIVNTLQTVLTDLVENVVISPTISFKVKRACSVTIMLLQSNPKPIPWNVRLPKEILLLRVLQRIVSLAAAAPAPNSVVEWKKRLHHYEAQVKDCEAIYNAHYRAAREWETQRNQGSNPNQRLNVDLIEKLTQRITQWTIDRAHELDDARTRMGSVGLDNLGPYTNILHHMEQSRQTLFEKVAVTQLDGQYFEFVPQPIPTNEAEETNANLALKQLLSDFKTAVVATSTVFTQLQSELTSLQIRNGISSSSVSSSSRRDRDIADFNYRPEYEDKGDDTRPPWLLCDLPIPGAEKTIAMFGGRIPTPRDLYRATNTYNPSYRAALRENHEAYREFMDWTQMERFAARRENSVKHDAGQQRYIH